MVTNASIAQVWDWLGEIPDPEIPVVSVVDLGIVREVSFADDACVVTITPTYSGCPAMEAIAESIAQALHARGLDKLRLATRLAPAWTTDWMSEAGKAALKAYGIAPPERQAIDISGLRSAAEEAAACPRCGSGHTRLISQFGSTPCKALYQCLDCHEPFDYFKSH
jgi:ring-1,2-phenylacetyl-CoA epoxidase subunit PaaD